MINKNSSATKENEKILAAKKTFVSKVPANKVHPVTPNASCLDDDLVQQRKRHVELTEALKAIDREATDQLKRSFDLVWFVRNRMRHPNHEASRRIEKSEQYKAELEKLRGPNGDYHHGVNSGFLAVGRLFREGARTALRCRSDMKVWGKEDELISLRIQNDKMANALNALVMEANQHMEKSSDLIWFTQNRMRYPGHTKMRRMENSRHYKDDIEKLRGSEGDSHFGFNVGVRDATILLKDFVDIPGVVGDNVDSTNFAVQADKQVAALNAETDCFP